MHDDSVALRRHRTPSEPSGSEFGGSHTASTLRNVRMAYYQMTDKLGNDRIEVELDTNYRIGCWSLFWPEEENDLTAGSAKNLASCSDLGGRPLL